jgi:hypothetical protein
MPLTGRKSKNIAKNKIKIGAKINDGIAIKIAFIHFVIWFKKLLFKYDIKRPKGIPIMTAIETDKIANKAVFTRAGLSKNRTSIF